MLPTYCQHVSKWHAVTCWPGTPADSFLCRANMKFSRKEMVWLGLHSFWRIKLQWRSNWNLISIKSSWLCHNTRDHRSCYLIFREAINLEWSGGKVYPENNYWNKYWCFLCDSSNFIVGTSTMCDPRLWRTQYIIHCCIAKAQLE